MALFDLIAVWETHVLALPIVAHRLVLSRPMPALW